MKDNTLAQAHALQRANKRQTCTQFTATPLPCVFMLTHRRALRAPVEISRARAHVTGQNAAPRLRKA
jgi:hypothetical protein